ncbi:DUF1566 domain-containing protein, partial [Leptospira perolatii]|uniref:Lcl domain-containing protein n=1 Tax=Leptospira perolatii TaxID=2023191 RepID=UPI000F63AC5A
SSWSIGNFRGDDSLQCTTRLLLPPTPVVYTITITPSISSIMAGNTSQLRADLYGDGIFLRDVTEEATWSSTDTSVLTVSDATGTKGLVTAVTQGSASIEASLPSPVSTSQSMALSIDPIPDTTAPTLVTINIGSGQLNPSNISIEFIFSEPMNTSSLPNLQFEVEEGGGLYTAMSRPHGNYQWTNSTTLKYDSLSIFPEFGAFKWSIAAGQAADLAGNVTANSNAGSFATGEMTLNLLAFETYQEACWNSSGSSVACAGTGQDAAFLSLALNMDNPAILGGYSLNPVTVDHNTNLTWTTCSIGQVWSSGSGNCRGTGASPLYGAITYNWSQSINQCIALNLLNSSNGYAGKKGWRLPTIKELQSIVELNGTDGNQPVDSAKFPDNLRGEQYWTSTTRVTNSLKGFKIHFSAGKTQYNDKTNLYYARCVTSQ